MTEGPGSGSDGAALAWRTLRDYEEPDRYAHVAGPDDADVARHDARRARSCGHGLPLGARAGLSLLLLRPDGERGALDGDRRTVGGLRARRALRPPPGRRRGRRRSRRDRRRRRGVRTRHRRDRVRPRGRPDTSRRATPASHGSPAGWPATTTRTRPARTAAGSRGSSGSAPADRWRIARLLQPSPGLRGVHRLLVAATRPRLGAGGRARAIALAAAGLPQGAAAVVAGVVWAGLVFVLIGVTIALLRSPTVAGWVVALLTPGLLVTVVLAGLAATAVAALVTLAGWS